MEKFFSVMTFLSFMSWFFSPIGILFVASGWCDWCRHVTSWEWICRLLMGYNFVMSLFFGVYKHKKTPWIWRGIGCLSVLTAYHLWAMLGFFDMKEGVLGSPEVLVIVFFSCITLICMLWFSLTRTLPNAPWRRRYFPLMGILVAVLFLLCWIFYEQIQ